MGNVMFALTSIKGIGRRYANIVLKKADIPMHKRAGELCEEDVEKIITIMQNPRQYKIPDWFLNRQRDHKDGKTNQVMANILDNKLREDLVCPRRNKCLLTINCSGRFELCVLLLLKTFYSA